MKKIIFCFLAFVYQMYYAHAQYESQNLNINGLDIGKYGSTLAGDANPFKINSPSTSGTHDLILFGSSAATLNFRLLDGSLKMGPGQTVTAEIFNNGNAYYGGYIGVGIRSPKSPLHIWDNGSDYTGLRFDGGNSSQHNAYVMAGKSIGYGLIMRAHNTDFSKGQSAIVLNSGDTTATNQAKATIISNIIHFKTGKSYSDNITDDSFGTSAFYISNDQTIGIGTTAPDPLYKLSVNGKIRANEIRVETGWADFVFEDDYKLKSLEEVEHFIKENKHLPEIPSAEEVAENGVSVGQMGSKLLQKIEELTLYVIEQNKMLKEQHHEIASLKNKVKELEQDKELKEY